MQVISDGKITPVSFEREKTFNGNSNRAYIMSLIIAELDKRVGQKYVDAKGKTRVVKKTNPRFLGVRLAYLSDFDLRYHYDSCLKAPVPFSQAFWGRLKPKT